MTGTNIDVQYRPKDAAKKLGIGNSTFWALVKKDPDFPHLTRIGRTTSVSGAALDEYIVKKTGGVK